LDSSRESPEPGRDITGTVEVVKSTRIDDTDKLLIAMLQVDGRIPYSRLARQVGLSEAAVRARVRALLGAGVIQIVAVTDPLQLGFTHEALVGIQGAADPVVLADQLAAIEQVDFIVLVAGAFEILLEIVAEDEDEFLVLVQRIRALAAPGTLQVLPYLKTWKQEYSWGVR
jgi:Lrp/AsnC family transcriptional regulator, regulator for asnA, asnC and gidA